MFWPHFIVQNLFINLGDKRRRQILLPAVHFSDLITLSLLTYHLLSEVSFDTPHENLASPFFHSMTTL